jgi:hypothetical protein
MNWQAIWCLQTAYVVNMAEHFIFGGDALVQRVGSGLCTGRPEWDFHGFLEERFQVGHDRLQNPFLFVIYVFLIHCNFCNRSSVVKQTKNLSASMRMPIMQSSFCLKLIPCFYGIRRYCTLLEPVIGLSPQSVESHQRHLRNFFFWIFRLSFLYAFLMSCCANFVLDLNSSVIFVLC